MGTRLDSIKAIEARMIRLANAEGLRYEVQETYESFCKADPPQNIEDYHKHANAALYEWDI